MTKYTINELANSKGVSPLVREALLQMGAELEATNRQVEILSDALAESRREVAAKDEALDLALAALGLVDDDIEWQERSVTRKVVLKAITAIKQALAAPVQEPVAYVHNETGLLRQANRAKGGDFEPRHWTPLYKKDNL